MHAFETHAFDNLGMIAPAKPSSIFRFNCQVQMPG